MLNKLTTVLICSRAFSLPMTIMSWLVIFTYSALVAGHIRYGLLALAGICLAHLAANLLDDYFDYKSLIKQVSFNKKEYLKNSQKTKCRYLISGLIRPQDILILAFIYLAAASIIGLFFFIKCGIGVVYFALIGGIITILYSFMSKIRLSEFAVAVAYGPALFGGVYYVMTKTYSWDAIILSIPSMLVTVTLLYIHTVMDFDFDLNEGHKTVANSFNSQLDSLIVLKWLLISFLYFAIERISLSCAASIISFSRSYMLFSKVFESSVEIDSSLFSVFVFFILLSTTVSSLMLSSLTSP